jgi:hypothetical protein
VFISFKQVDLAPLHQDHGPDEGKIIDTLIAAVRAGELDERLNQAAKTRTSGKVATRLASNDLKSKGA